MHTIPGTDLVAISFTIHTVLLFFIGLGLFVLILAIIGVICNRGWNLTFAKAQLEDAKNRGDKWFEFAKAAKELIRDEDDRKAYEKWTEEVKGSRTFDPSLILQYRIYRLEGAQKRRGGD